MAEYYNLAFFRDAEGLYVNLYLPATVTWNQNGQRITARQETDFPESESSQLTLEMAAQTELALRFRVPGWSRVTTLALNGQPHDVAAVPGGWAALHQSFAPGDRLTITHRMDLRAVPVDPQHPFRAAVMYGPVVLAQDEACCRRPFALASYASLQRRLVKDGPGLRFRIINAVPERHTRYLLPLYTFRAFWPYWVYFDLDAEPLY